jgi:predicted CXXCH cytochrome family protein
MRFNKFAPWSGGGAIMFGMAAYFAYQWNSTDTTMFLPGPTSHGHYQIELQCGACHTPWNGVKENACYNCHAEELKLANDSHPKSKFTDPRNADRLQAIDASNCLTCHKEHVPAQTRTMGVTVPDDFCYHCHQQTLQDRPSHRDYPFNSCSTAGCHNYHDNTALYEDFLLKHLGEPDFKNPARVSTRPAPMNTSPATVPDGPGDPDIIRDWETTRHARAGVNCTGCHAVEKAGWSDTVSHASCAECHSEETAGFLAGKHGMRLAQGLSPMKPSMARQPMKPASAHLELSCVSCHGAHRFDSRRAAVDACLDCHNDEHSLAYKSSPHFELWSDDDRAGTGVSCATCHLPREEGAVDGVTRVFVQHNQNANLRPNEKMVRDVCLKCHGLGFTLNALADPALIRSNFQGRPTISLETLRLAEERSREGKKK